jgi:hypothetical protein
VSDHPVCGAKVGFAKIFLMPQPPLLTRPHEEGTTLAQKNLLPSAGRHQDGYFGVVPGYDDRYRREFRYFGEREAIESGSDGSEFKRAVLTNSCFETANDGSG